MTLTPRKMIGLGVALFLFFLVWTMPAQQVYSLAQGRLFSPQTLELHGIGGTWLAGRADGGRIGGQPIKDLSWRFRPSLSAPLGMRLDLVAGADSRITGWAGVGPGGRLAVRNLRGVLALDLLAPVLARMGIAVSGRLGLDIDRLDLRRGRPIRLAGEVMIQQLASVQPQAIPLGDFAGELRGRDGELGGKFRDLGGPLSAAGRVGLQPDGSYELELNLNTRDPENSQLRTILGMLGPAGRDGSVSIARQGRLNWQ